MRSRYLALCLLSFLATSCAEDVALESDDAAQTTTRANREEGDVFYYFGYEDRKIFLNRVKDKIFVKFAPNATKEQFQSVVNDNT